MKVLVVLVLAVFSGKFFFKFFGENLHFSSLEMGVRGQLTFPAHCLCSLLRLQCPVREAAAAQTPGRHGEGCFLGLCRQGNLDRRGLPEADPTV